MYTNYAKLWRNYHIYGINLRCGLPDTDFSAWLYDIYERKMASKRQFREVKSAEDFKKMFDAIPRSTHSVTKWEIKIFHEWQATKGNKNFLEEQVSFKFDMNKVQEYLCQRDFYQICF